MAYKDPAKEKAYKKEWWEDNKERINAKLRDRRKENPEEFHTKDKEAYERRDKEKRKATQEIWYIAHFEEVAANKKRYALEHPEMMRACKRKWNKEHPDIKNASTQRHRARKAGLLATLTAEQWLAILVAYKFRCAYCGKKFKKLTKDHVVPVVLGGGTVCWNIVPACMPCNSSKGGRDALIIPPIRLMF